MTFNDNWEYVRPRRVYWDGYTCQEEGVGGWGGQATRDQPGPVNGEIGPCGSLYWWSRNAANGDGSSVAEIQRSLNRAGFSTYGVDGIYGTNTKNAARAFQSAHSLSPDGIVGLNTWSKLRNY